MMGLRYTASYYDIDNNLVKVDILKNDYDGEADELLLSADPLTINYESDDIFKPIKYSGCSIKISTAKILTDLYTGKVFDSQIRIYKNNTLFWEGYISPNIYNSEWLTDYDEITIEGIDTLSALQYKDFTYTPTGKDKPTDFLTLISYCLNSFEDSEMLSVVYQSLLDNNNRLLLSELSILERNWYNEDGESKSKINEVLADIMQFIGCSMYQFKNKYYIVDISTLGVENVVIAEMPLNDMLTPRERTNHINYKTYNVRENNSDVALGDTYNKVNVVCSLVDIENNAFDLNSSTMEDDADILANYDVFSLYNKTANDAHLMFYQRIVPKNVENNDYYFLYTDEAYLAQPQTKGFGTFMREAPIAAKWINKNGDNVTPYYFKQSSLDWNSYFSYKLGDKITNPHFLVEMEILREQLLDGDTETEVLKIYSNDIVSYPSGGYFLLHEKFSFGKYIGKQCGYVKGNYSKESTFSNQYVIEQYKPNLVKHDRNYNIYFIFLAKLKVGNKYWNGETWQSEECKFTYNSEGKYCYQAHTDEITGVFNVENTNNFTVRTESDNAGWIIPITTDLCGKVEFTLYDNLVTPNTFYDWQDLKDPWTIIDNFNVDALEYCYIDNLSIEYTPQSKADQYAIIPKDKADNDLLYTQTIDDNIISELSDIQLNVNTYNENIHNKLSYSYVFRNNKYLAQIEKNGSMLRPEEHILRMYANYYSTPKIKHTNTIEFDVSPTDLIYINSLKKYLLLGGNITYNLYDNNATVEMIEM